MNLSQRNTLNDLPSGDPSYQTSWGGTLMSASASDKSLSNSNASSDSSEISDSYNSSDNSYLKE